MTSAELSRGPRQRLLAVEDSPEILSALQRGLQRRGYEVIACADGESALRAFRRERPDLVILDLLLPDVDGLDLCYQFQEMADTPVIMLTSRDAIGDRVEGLRAGADDYIVKPFAMEELSARIEAVLRRRPAAGSTLAHEDLRMDVGAHEVKRGTRRVSLTRTEFSLLHALCRRPNHVVTRESLTGAVWPDADAIDDNLLDAHIANLRQKLESGGERRLIQTVRGIGFVLR